MENTITALDTETMIDVGLVQPEPSNEAPEGEVVEVTEPAVESEPITTEDEKESTPDPEPKPDVINIEGIGEVSVNDVKEWQRGNLRQQDYTKKTQELAQQRQEAQEALEVFNYLKGNPHLIEQLQHMDESATGNPSVISKASPQNEMMQQMWYNQKSMEIDRTLERLKTQYGDIDEIMLFDTAREMNTDNLEFVYKALMFDGKKVDEQSLIEKAKNELKAELQKTKTSTSTIVSTKQSQTPVKTVTISPEEARVASGMNMSNEDYVKWRDK